MEFEHGHSEAEIRERFRAGPQISYLRDWIYGGIDGAVTTFAIVTGVIGANLPGRIVLILGAANLLADGFSMAAANYLSTKAEADEYRHIRDMEERHVDLAPEGEREEIRQILAAKGFENRSLDHAVDVITSNRRYWIDCMMAEEHNMPPVSRSAVRSALATFAAFFLCGLVPLLPFVLGLPATIQLSTLLTALTFIAIGSFRSKWSNTPYWRAGLETAAVGLAAAGIAFLIGKLLAGL